MLKYFYPPDLRSNPPIFISWNLPDVPEKCTEERRAPVVPAGSPDVLTGAAVVACSVSAGTFKFRVFLG